MFFPSPFNWLYVFYYPVEQGGFAWQRTFDNLLMVWSLVLIMFCAVMVYVIVCNLRNRTNSIDKLQKVKAEGIRSANEMKLIIFG